MTARIGLEFDNKVFYHVTADLGYLLKQLESMEVISRLVVEYLNSGMREGNLKPASRAKTVDRLSRLHLS